MRGIKQQQQVTTSQKTNLSRKNIRKYSSDSQGSSQSETDQNSHQEESWFKYNKSTFIFHYPDPETIQLLSEDDQEERQDTTSQETKNSAFQNKLQNLCNSIETQKQKYERKQQEKGSIKEKLQMREVTTQFPKPSFEEKILAQNLRESHKLFQQQTEFIQSKRNHEKEKPKKSFKSYPAYFAIEGKLSNELIFGVLPKSFGIAIVLMIVMFIMTLSAFSINAITQKSMSKQSGISNALLPQNLSISNTSHLFSPQTEQLNYAIKKSDQDQNQNQQESSEQTSSATTDQENNKEVNKFGTGDLQNSNLSDLISSDLTSRLINTKRNKINQADLQLKNDNLQSSSTQLEFKNETVAN